jgi:hypothetical protein
VRDVEVRTLIEDTLKQRHPVDTKEWWQSLGRNSSKIIISIYKTDHSTYHQIRLINALAWFDEPGVVDFLKEQAVHHSNPIVKREALRSIGLSQGLKEKEFLQQGLESSDPHTRVATARLFKDFKDPAADQLLGNFLNHEKTDWVVTKVREHRRYASPNLTIEGKGRKD